jgi:hypothetical protein
MGQREWGCDLEGHQIAIASSGIVGGQQDGAVGECGLDGIQRGFSFAFRGGGAGGELRVGLIGGEAGWRDRRRRYAIVHATSAGGFACFAVLGAADGTRRHGLGSKRWARERGSAPRACLKIARAGAKTYLGFWKTAVSGWGGWGRKSWENCDWLSSSKAENSALHNTTVV